MAEDIVSGMETWLEQQEQFWRAQGQEARERAGMAATWLAYADAHAVALTELRRLRGGEETPTHRFLSAHPACDISVSIRSADTVGRSECVGDAHVFTATGVEFNCQCGRFVYSDAEWRIAE